MRIVTGYLRGRRIKVPVQARPLPGLIREAIFQMLDVRDSLVLDLFAGSGALSFEALSCGAQKAIAVDLSPQAIRFIKDNARRLGVEGLVKTYRKDVINFLHWAHNMLRDIINDIPKLIVFSTPPFCMAKLNFEVLKLLSSRDYEELLSGLEETSAVLQFPRRGIFHGSYEDYENLNWEVTKRKVYGDNFIVILKYKLP